MASKQKPEQLTPSSPATRDSTCLHKGSKQFWAMPFNPNEASPQRDHGSVLNKQNPGLKGLVIELDKTAIGPIAKDRRTFERCWFTGSLEDIDIANWKFSACTFDQSQWKKVKFSDCSFEKCHFYKMELNECAFMESCEFKENSCSPELVWMKDTMINATSFLNAVTTNLMHLPKKIEPDYQKWRLATTTIANIAVLIHSSTRGEPNLAFYNAAQKELILADINSRIESKRYFLDKKAGGAKYRKRHSMSFYVLTAVQRLERFLVRTAGELTQWGQSISRACLVLIFLVLLFGIIYQQQGWIPTLTTSPQEPPSLFISYCLAFFKALNITLVAGYTSYFDAKSDLLRQSVEIANLVAGIFWYSLIVPVLSRKVLR